jgi:hypothetical protein
MVALRSGPVSIYILVATLVGAVVGGLFGLAFDDLITGRRMIAILAAAAGIAVEYGLRRYARERLAPLYRGAPPAGVSLPRAFTSAIIAIAGGLAAHDLSLIYAVTEGWTLGAFSGLFAALMKSVLVVLGDLERAAAPSSQGRMSAAKPGTH